MRFKVYFYKENNILISEDIWYANSMEEVKFWVDTAIKDMIKYTNYKTIRYEINELIG